MPPRTRCSSSIMRRCCCSLASAGLSICAFALSVPVARAETDESPQPGVAPYCDYAWGATSSSVSQQLYPRLYLSGGVLTGAESVNVTGSTGSGSGTLWRLQAGLSYGLADLAEGLALRDRARAECMLYRHQSELFAFLARYEEPDSVAGALAKIHVLQEALPVAERILLEVRDLFLRHQATVEEVNATGLRVDTLRSELGSSRAHVAASARKHRVSAQPVTELMRSYRATVEQVAQSESRVRMSRRFDLALRAGYDQLFGVRYGIPLAATLTFTINPGALLAQPPAEEQAQRGRIGWASFGLEGIHDRVAILVSRLRAVLEAQSRRTQETSVLLADLEARYKAVEGMQGDAVRPYRDYLWFDLIRLRAEDAYLRAQMDELGSLLPPDGDATALP